MIIKFVSWNVRGLRSDFRKIFVKNLIQSSKALIFFLQETLLESVSSKDTHQICGSHNYGWISQN